jgi:hypothetical protein
MQASLLSFFYRNWFNEWSSNDKVILKPWLVGRMQQDFILLENQLPFFIIEKLFDLAFASNPGFSPFVELTFKYFSSYKGQGMSPCPKLEILHFADLLRKFYLPPSLPNRRHIRIEHMYTATQLAGVGLKFEAVCSSKYCLLDLDLDCKKKVLKIPRFTLDNDTELCVQNILALEQCLYPRKAYVTDYFILLSFLLNGEKDLDILSREGILVNGFGNKEPTRSLVAWLPGRHSTNLF